METYRKEQMWLWPAPAHLIYQWGATAGTRLVDVEPWGLETHTPSNTSHLKTVNIITVWESMNVASTPHLLCTSRFYVSSLHDTFGLSDTFCSRSLDYGLNTVFQLLLSFFFFSFSFSLYIQFQDIIGFGVNFWHSDNMINRKRINEAQSKDRGARNMEVYRKWIDTLSK